MSLLVAALVVFGSVASAPAGADGQVLDEALRRVVADDGLAGAVAVVRGGDGEFSRVAAGFSDVATRAGFVPDTHVRVASITKTYVASVILQLVAEGRIELDASIERYLPNRIRGAGIDADAITVRHLLRHQSGLPEHFDADTPEPTDPVTGDQLLDMALVKPAQFPPGSQMRYTNTNYIVAGLLIEAVTGTPAAEEVTRRVIAPLGLNGTYFPASGDDGLRAPFAHGYEVEGGVRTDVTDFNAAAAGMAGSLVSTNEDTSAFITALLDGRVVPPVQLVQMMETVEQPDLGPGFRYGLGLASVDLPCGGVVWGHGGDLDGYHTLMVKPVGGEALSMTITQGSDSTSVADDPRIVVARQFYCR